MKISAHVFEKSNILYSKLPPYLNKVIIADEAAVCSSEILPLYFWGNPNFEYLLLFLRNPFFVAYANKSSYVVKMPGLGTSDGRNAIVPLPPLAEQKRIVAKVEELMQACAQGRIYG